MRRAWIAIGLAFALAPCAAGAIGQFYFTNGLPSATLPLSGTERIPADSAGGSAEALTPAQLASYSGSAFVAGGVNKFRNAGMDVNQRGLTSTPVSISTSGAYTFDGWWVKPTGAAVGVQKGTGHSGAFQSLQVNGASSVTDVLVEQPIESYVAAALAGQQVTIQFAFEQTTGTSVAPKVSTCWASAQDNFATCTSDLAPVVLTSCGSGAWCTEAYAFPVSTSAGNGYEVRVDCGALANGQSCLLTALDIRVTPAAPTGVQASPPLAELRPLWQELPGNQRYFVQSCGNGLAAGIANRACLVGGNGMSTATGASAGTFAVHYPVQLRATPSSLLYWDGTGTPSRASTYNGSWADGLSGGTFALTSGPTGFSVFGLGGTYAPMFQYQASAEITP